MTTFVQWVYGILMLFLKGAMFVFTNKRIFMVPTRFNYAYRRSLAHIPYSETQQINAKGKTLLVPCRVGGQAKKFIGLKRKEDKKIRVLVLTLKPDNWLPEDAQMCFLCPRCTEELEEGVFSCKKCDQEFRPAGKARLLSLAVPGGGYFYMDHPVLCAFTAMIEIILLALIILLGLWLYNATTDPTRIAWLAGTVVVFGLVKFIAAHHAGMLTEEYVPIRIAVLEKQDGRDK
ncbi:MAG: hypothetical protein ACLFPD_11120 [Desulfosudaceae bacterium]